MKGSVKAIVAGVAVLVLAGAAFWAGTAYQAAQDPALGFARGGALTADGTMPGGGGLMASLTDEERAQLQSMTDEERAAFMEEKFGEGGLPAGGPMRGGTLEGEVLEIADDTITLALSGGGSQTVYTDSETLVAYADGAGDLAVGAQVLVIAEPAADGVTNASVMVVK
ncbi:MAG: hypothetical protein JXP72_00740 [Coriobacteriia bacterium]|nr:hypothetical protein [Coriobacteriia bacterium]